MPITRVRAQWSGFNGAPGYSQFHFQSSTGEPDAAGDRALVHQFFAAVDNWLASPVRISVDSTVEILDSATGQLIDYADDDTELPQLTGGSSGAYSAASGAVVNWLTNTVVGGRRLRGRTFLVPASPAAYQSDGTLDPTALTALNNGASILSGAGFSSGFGILSRPAGGGQISFGEVTGHRIPDMAAVLRSRRD